MDIVSWQCDKFSQADAPVTHGEADGRDWYGKCLHAENQLCFLTYLNIARTNVVDVEYCARWQAAASVTAAGSCHRHTRSCYAAKDERFFSL